MSVAFPSHNACEYSQGSAMSSSSCLSSLLLVEDSLQSSPSRVVADDNVATVTVKFFINAEEMFTKAFKNSDTIDDIKSQLASLFSVDSARIRLSKGEQMLNNDFRLAGLGVEALGTVDLSVSTDSPLALNRDLIYGYIPTVDVISVQGRGGSEHAVEIEYQRLEKQWLGGYRHKVTKKEYHHASTQTPFDHHHHHQQQKISKSVQVYATSEKSTSTPIDKVVQTTIVPNSRDKWLFPRARPPTDDDEEVEIPPMSPAVREPEPCIRKIYRQIVRWNRVENEKLGDLEEPQRQERRFEILDLTRKLLMRVDRKRTKRDCARRSETVREILSRTGAPKVVVSKTGDRISVDTVEAQQARRLKQLYFDYRRHTDVETKLKVVSQLQDFFSRAEYEFSADVLKLLHTESNLLAKGLVGTAHLARRIEQFILYLFKRLANERGVTRERPCFKALPDLGPYRNILVRLQEDEVKVFKCVTSVCFRMQEEHMYRLVHEVWADCSVKSECRDLNALRMTRWRTQDEWNVTNCLLLDKYEVKEHFASRITDYEQCFVSKVKNNHFRAQLLFVGDSLFDEDKILK